MKQSLPNVLTLLRILMLPIIVINLYFAHNSAYYYLVSSIALITASITDFADGYFARIWKAQSNLGTFLDPIADKLIIVTSIIMLIYVGKITNYTIIPCVIIILREIVISGAREVMGNFQIAMPVSYTGKIKTTLQMIGVIAVMLSGSNILGILNMSGLKIFTLLNTSLLQHIGEITIWAAAIFSIYSGYQYLAIPIRYLANKNIKINY